MRKMNLKKSIVSVLALVMCADCMSGFNSVSDNTVSAARYQSYDVIDSNGVVCTGAFDNLTSGQIVFYPSALKETTETYPVVVWANGTMCPPALYYELLSEIAAGGYIVVTNTDMMAADGTTQRGSIDFILGENADSSSVFYNRVDTEHIASAGHSQGGRSAVNAATADSRIDCVLSIAGSNYASEVTSLSVPTFFMTGTSDMIVLSSMWVKPAYNKCNGPAVYASLKGGVHTSCCANPSVYSKYAIKWFDAYLKNDSFAKSCFVNGGDLSKDRSWSGYTSKDL